MDGEGEHKRTAPTILREKEQKGSTGQQYLKELIPLGTVEKSASLSTQTVEMKGDRPAIQRKASLMIRGGGIGGQEIKGRRM